MVEDTRDKLWELVFETFYDSYYEEIVADKLVYRWQLFDQISKVLIALTASGSAVSGWALWNQPAFRNIWVTLAGLGAVLSIIHAALSVSSRLKEWRDVKTSFVVLRIDFGDFLESHGAEAGLSHRQFHSRIRTISQAVLRSDEPDRK